VAAEDEVTRIPRYLTRIVFFLAALLGLSPEETCDILPQALSSSRAATADPIPQRTVVGCPEGQCVIGMTNSVPPRLICGECRTGTPHPTPSDCPKPLAAGAVAYLDDKPYGQGFGSTVRVRGDPEFCRLIHGVWVDDCHLEGWSRRVECEMDLIHGCPIWQFTVDGGKTFEPCVDDQAAPARCDHFGSFEHRDDPQTPTTGDTLETLQGFEGRPLECGLQRDAHGPMAGFFTMAHGIGRVRACKPDQAACGPWWPFDR
jgi:hypothetical protein